MVHNVGDPVGFVNGDKISTGKIKADCGDGTYKVAWTDGYVDPETYYEADLLPLD